MVPNLQCDSRQPMGANSGARWLSEYEDFFALKDEWNRLASATKPDCVFLRHQWFDAAWRWLRTDCALRILVYHRQSKIVGICPLIVKRERYRSMPVRKTGFLAVPDTQYCDLLVTPEDHEEVCRALAGALAASSSEWDVLDLEYLATDSPTVGFLIDALNAKGLRSISAAGGENPYISLVGGWQNFYAGRSRRLKKNNNLVANRMKAAGNIRLMRLDATAEPSSVWQALEHVVALSARSWKQHTGLTLDNARPGAFVQELTRHAIEQDWLLLWLLYLNDILVAMEYQLTFNGHVHALRADFDETYRDLSPGSFLNWKILEALFEERAQCYWMGPGGNSYKLRWTDDASTLARIVAYSNTWRGKTLWLLRQQMLPRLRRLRDFASKARAAQGGGL
jgi:CelD/BcsL family acetyltransferase involved in cellulose biosynthesis